MKCPKCEAELRQSKKDPSYGLCDNCKKKFKLPNTVPAKEDSAKMEQDPADSKKYSNIPPKHVRHARESEMKKNYSDMLSMTEDADAPVPFDGLENSSKSPKKKGIILIIVLLLLILLAGGALFCYKSGIASDLINKVTGESKSSKKGKNLHYKTDKFELSYTDYALSTDYKGKECLVVYFEFTNIGETSTNAGYEVNIAASQGDTSCEPTSLESFDEAVDSIYLDVDPYSSVKIGKVFELTDKSDVTLEVSDLLGLSDKTASQTITIK